MKKYLITEILCVLLCIVYIIYSVGDTSVKTNKTADELSSALLEMMSTDDLNERSINFISEQYNIDASVFSSVSCFTSDDVMNVSEIFIGVFADSSDDTVCSAMNEYSQSRYSLYNGYAAEQAALLDNSIIVVKAGVLFFCVDENAEKIYSEFLKII